MPRRSGPDIVNGLHHRPLARMLAPVLARPALRTAAIIAFLLYWLLPGSGVIDGHWRLATRLLVAWNVFIALYLLLVARVMQRSSVEDIRRRAPLNDAGARTILSLSVVSAAASFAAVVAELSQAKQGGPLGAVPLVFAALTIVASWAFVHVMFALHYAHDFYAPDTETAHAPLTFPGTVDPHYGDFLYFSFVIGCACATADVNISAPEMRRLAMAHGIIAFFFNAAIVGLSINIAAGLLGN